MHYKNKIHAVPQSGSFIKFPQKVFGGDSYLLG